MKHVYMIIHLIKIERNIQAKHIYLFTHVYDLIVSILDKNITRVIYNVIVLIINRDQDTNIMQSPIQHSIRSFDF